MPEPCSTVRPNYDQVSMHAGGVVQDLTVGFAVTDLRENFERNHRAASGPYVGDLLVDFSLELLFPCLFSLDEALDTLDSFGSLPDVHYVQLSRSQLCRELERHVEGIPGRFGEVRSTNDDSRTVARHDSLPFIGVNRSP